MVNGGRENVFSDRRIDSEGFKCGHGFFRIFRVMSLSKIDISVMPLML